MKLKTISCAGTELSVFGYQEDPYFTNIDSHFTPSHFLAPLLTHHVAQASYVIDVGANIGAITALINKLVKDVKVVAIEPSGVFNCLERTVEANECVSTTCLQSCVGSIDGEVSFFDASDSSASHIAQVGGRPVPIKRLDTIVKEQGLPTVDFVKIDVEGAENAVLDGMTEINVRFRPLIFMEFNSFTLTAYGNESPMRMLRRVRDEFKCFFALRDGQLAKFSSDDDLLGFLHTNMIVHGCVDDIVFTASEARRAAFRL